MKLISIDIETTGVDPNKDQILSIALLKVDTASNTIGDSMNIFVPHRRIKGTPYAIEMNTAVIGLNALYYSKKMTDLDFLKTFGFDYILEDDRIKYLSYIDFNGEKLKDPRVISDLPESVISRFTDKANFNALGKNFDVFDKPFIEIQTKLFRYVKPERRVADPSALWVKPEDKKLPSLQICMVRAGMETAVTHDALQDAKDTAEVYLKGLDRLK